MKQNPIEEGRISSRGEGLGTVTEEMVRQRAGEIAVINGRSKHNVLDIDLEQARRELQGEEGLNPAPTAAENLTEDQRWGVDGTNSGHKVPAIPASDEQTVTEKLVEEGIADAEHDQQVEATRASLQRDKRS